MVSSSFVRRLSICAALALALAAANGVQAADASPDSKPAFNSIADVTAKLKRQDGLVPLYLDAEGGRVLMRLPAAAADGAVLVDISSFLTRDVDGFVDAQKTLASAAPPGMPIGEDDEFEAGLMKPAADMGNGDESVG